VHLILQFIQTVTLIKQDHQYHAIHTVCHHIFYKINHYCNLCYLMQRPVTTIMVPIY